MAAVVVGCSRQVPADRGVDRVDGASPSAVVGAAVPNVVVDAALEASERADAEGDAGALAGSSELVELTADGDKLGFVSVPLGAREPRPVMIAIHGGSERPEEACAAWRGIAEGYPFVVCPRGFGGNDKRLGWRTAADTSVRVARATQATKKLFGAWVKDTSTVVLAGFSMGGAQVARLARAEPHRYRRIAPGDSAHDPWPAKTFSEAWAAGGGERALFLCTTSGCEPSMRTAARNVAARKAHARLNVADIQVHGLGEAAVQSMRRDWPWLVEGAEGWETYVAPSEASLPGRTERFDPP